MAVLATVFAVLATPLSVVTSVLVAVAVGRLIGTGHWWGWGGDQAERDGVRAQAVRSPFYEPGASSLAPSEATEDGITLSMYYSDIVVVFVLGALYSAALWHHPMHWWLGPIRRLFKDDENSPKKSAIKYWKRRLSSSEVEVELEGKEYWIPPGELVEMVVLSTAGQPGNTVYKARQLRLEYPRINASVAVKALPKRLPTTGGQSVNEAATTQLGPSRELVREVKIQMQFQHNNIVQFLGLSSDRPDRWLIVMELCNGSLWDRLRDTRLLPCASFCCVEP